MKRGHFMVLLLVLALVPGMPAYGGMGGGNLEKIMDAADNAISEGDLDGSIEKLEAVNRDGLTDEDLSRLHFLLGKAKYVKVSKDIRSCRSDGTQKASELQDHQVGPLKAALEHFQTSYKLSSESGWSEEALYATALIQGYGCLQRFEDAAETYKLFSEKYPDTNLGKIAAQKYMDLKTRLKDKGHGRSHP